MHSKYYIDKNDLIKISKKLINRPFVEIDSEYVWSFGYETYPYDNNYETPENFPNCCEFHLSVKEELEKWFENFPDSDENYKKFKSKYWFNKERYLNVPNKILNQLSFTENLY